ncbi:UNVERIFIED_CONTAM: hypothetical protein FKN15_046525 [Acipenser sinensis]
MHPAPRRGEPIGPEPRSPAAEKEYLLPLPPPPPPLPPAEGEYLLVPSQAPWEDSLPLPAPPAEDEYLLVPSQAPWEDCLPLPPPPAEGEYLLVSPPPPWKGLLLSCLAPPKDACLAPPKDACHASPGAACCSASPRAACCSASPVEPPVTGYEGEVELPLPPPWPGALLPSSPPEGPLLLPSPPEGPASPGVVEGPALPGVTGDSASPGVATSLAMRQEILWLEPHEGELSATKKGGEVRRPAPPAAISLQNGWPEPQGGELPAMKKGMGRSGDHPQNFLGRRSRPVRGPLGRYSCLGGKRTSRRGRPRLAARTANRDFGN